MSPKSLVVTPLEAPSNNAALAPAKSQTHLPQRILVVDDDTAIRQLNSEVLIGSGYRVDTAEDGDAGWKVLHAVRYDPDSYDLLITDNNRPKVSGVELIEKLRSARMTVPVIMLSGASPTNTDRLQLAAILPKPFSPDQLVQTVKEVLHWSTAGANRKSPLEGRRV